MSVKPPPMYPTGALDMPVIRRTKPVASVIEPDTTSSRITMRRALTPVRAGSAADKVRMRNVVEARIHHNLQLIADAYVNIDAASAVKEKAEEEIDRLMRDNNMTVCEDEVMVASLKEVFSRQVRTIDPKKFKNEVPNDVFWATIEVPISKAEKVLSTRELNAIATIIPSTSNGYSLSVKKKKKT